MIPKTTIERSNDGYLWTVRSNSLINGVVQDKLGFYNKEQEILDRVANISSHDGVFIDLGANVGGFSIRMADVFKKVLAIEANPFNFIALVSNKFLNDKKNLIPLNMAASKPGTDRFVKIKNNGGGSHIKEVSEDYSNVVFSSDLDTIIHSCLDTEDKISAIKIDTEGCEEDIILGALDLIEKHKPVLMIEFHEKTYSRMPGILGTTKRVTDLLEKEFGYKTHFKEKTGYGDDRIIMVAS